MSAAASQASGSKRQRTFVLAAVVVLANVLGNAFLSLGTRNSGLLDGPAGALRGFLSPFTILGIAILIVWMISQAALLSWADLSYVLPITSASYLLTNAVGVLLLHEEVSTVRWAAAILITAGIVLVAPTPPDTTGPPS